MANDGHATTNHNALADALFNGGAYKAPVVFLKCFTLGAIGQVLFSVASLRRILATQQGCLQVAGSGLMFGLFGGLLKGCSCLGTQAWGQTNSSRVVLVSTFIAAASALHLEKNTSRRSTYASYAFVRALYATVVLDYVLKDAVPPLPSCRVNNNSSTINNTTNITTATTTTTATATTTTTTTPPTTQSFWHHALQHHGAPLLFVVSCTQIMWCWFYYPSYVEGVYRTWITRMAHMDVDLVRALHHLHHGLVQYGVSSNVLEQYSLRHGLDPRQANLLHFVPMNYVHPATGHWTSLWLVRRFVVGMFDALPLYTPVYVLPVVVFQFPKVWQQPLSTLWSVARNIAQSASFLASFIALAWMPILWTRRLLRKDTSFGVWLGCVCCGCSIYLERPSRRRELAMFVFPRALGIWWEYLVAKRWVRPRQNGGLWLFAVSSAVVVERAMRREEGGGSPGRKEGAEEGSGAGQTVRVGKRVGGKRRRNKRSSNLFSGLAQVLLR